MSQTQSFNPKYKVRFKYSSYIDVEVEDARNEIDAIKKAEVLVELGNLKPNKHISTGEVDVEMMV